MAIDQSVQGTKGTTQGPLHRPVIERHLAGIDQQAESMPSRVVEQMPQRQGVKGQLKAPDQMAWAAGMNDIRASVIEIVNKEIIYA